MRLGYATYVILVKKIDTIYVSKLFGLSSLGIRATFVSHVRQANYVWYQNVMFDPAK